MGQKIAKDTGIDTAAGKVSYFDYIFFYFLCEIDNLFFFIQVSDDLAKVVGQRNVDKMGEITMTALGNIKQFFPHLGILIMHF